MKRNLTFILLGIAIICLYMFVISSYNDISDYKYSELPQHTIKIIKYKGTDKRLILPQTLHQQRVTMIGEGAFHHDKNLQSVTILDNIEYIGGGAFSECSQLTYVHLGKKIKHIYPKTFCHCYSLTQINLDDITHLDMNAFQGCENLREIHMPQLENIGIGAFSHCWRMEKVFLGKVTCLYENTFQGCYQLQEVYLPKTLKYIYQDAFLDCLNLKDIYYEGSQEDWQNIYIEDKVNLSYARIHFNEK